MLFNSFKMLTKECRVCGRSNICSRALNLFDSGNRKHLRHINMLTGLRLRNRPELPVMICYCCQSDIKTFMTFRRHCLKNARRWNPQVKTEETTQSEEEEKATEKQPKSLPNGSTILIADPTEYGRRVLPPRKTRENPFKKYNEMDLNLDDGWEPLEPVQIIVEQNKEFVNQEEQNQEERDQLALSDEEDVEISIATVELEKDAIKPEGWDSSFDDEDQEEVKEIKTMRQPKIQIHKCDICGVVKNNKSSLVRHHYTHTGERPHPCKECPKAFLSGNELRAHVMTAHTKDPPFPCRYCERRYFSTIGRKKHERIHTNERPYVCDQCGKQFTNNFILKNHMLIHSGERLFSCDVCQRSFQRKSHLRTHFRSNTHQQNMEKKHKQPQTANV